MTTENIELMLDKYGKKIVSEEKKIMKKKWKHRDGETKDSVRTGKLINDLGYIVISNGSELVLEYDVYYGVYLDKGRKYNNGYNFKGIHFTKPVELIESDEFKHDLQTAFLKDFIKNIHQQNKNK